MHCQDKNRIMCYDNVLCLCRKTAAVAVQQNTQFVRGKHAILLACMYMVVYPLLSSSTLTDMF